MKNSQKMEHKSHLQWFLYISVIFCPFCLGNVSFERATEDEQKHLIFLSNKLRLHTENLTFLKSCLIFWSNVYIHCLFFSIINIRDGKRLKNSTLCRGYSAPQNPYKDVEKSFRESSKKRNNIVQQPRFCTFLTGIRQFSDINTMIWSKLISY